MSEDEALEAAVAAVETARRYCDDVEFSAEDASRTSIDVLLRFARAVVSVGARVVNLPDTVGYAMPAEISRMVKAIADEVAGAAVVSVHCHNDLGLATANSLAGVLAGARQIECTINGIGERAGNCALEEIVMAMAVRADTLPFVSGIRTPEILSTSHVLAEIVGVEPQPNKPIVGRNAFAHEAGIHQDGILKDPSTYEIMDPRIVGVPESRLVLGKHSGRHALGDRCERLGFRLGKRELEDVYRRFIALCDRKKTLSDEDIARIAGEVTSARLQVLAAAV